jgi:16S rRNA (cytosine967-C5)-methyltransferase
LAREIAVKVLQDVEAGRGMARELLDSSLEGRTMDPRDRDLAREIVYGTLRRLSSLDHLLARHSKARLRSLDLPVLSALRAAAYQVLFLDRVPDAAAVSAAVEHATAASGKRAGGYANAVLRALAREVTGREPGDGDESPRRSLPTGDGRHVLLASQALPDPAKDPLDSLAHRWSMPRWLVKRWREQFSDEDLRTVLRAGVARPSTWLQPVPGREAELQAVMEAADLVVASEEGLPGWRIRGAGAIDALPGYGAGLFTVQDPAAARAVETLAPAARERLIEIGAGRGGKTATLAARVAPGGSVVAVDRHGGRLGLLKDTLRRLHLEGVEAVEADATDQDALPDGPFDAALVDAPCSNTGVLARRVEARWRLKAQDLEALAALGRRMLEALLDRVRPGGRIVHSVCSLETDEGPDTVRRAIRKRDDWTLESEELILPRAGIHDGGYVALLRRAP